MKKNVLILFLICTTQFLSAQTEGELSSKNDKTEIGLKIGGQITNFSGDDAKGDETDSEVGLLAGGFFNYKFSKISTQAEVLFSNKGVKITDENDIINLFYIDVPIFLKYYFTDHFNIHAGPQVSFLTYAEYANDKVNDRYKETEFSVVGGLELVSGRGFSFGVRYSLGLTEIGEDYTITVENANERRTVTQDASDYKNYAYQVYLGFGF